MGLLNGQVIQEGDFKTTTAGSGDASKVAKAGADGYIDVTWLRNAIAAARTFGETISARDAVIVSDGLESIADVNQSLDSGSNISQSVATRHAQTFTIGAGSGAVALTGFYWGCTNTNSSPAGQWEVRTGTTLGGGSLVASGSFGTLGGNLSVTFSTPYTTTPGSTFHVIVWMTAGWMDSRGYTASDIYSGGAAYISTNSGGSYALHGTVRDWKFGTYISTKTAGRMYKCTAGTKEDFSGFALEAGTVGQSKFVQSSAGTIVTGFSGLTPAADYYIDNTTPGAITTATTTGKKVGIALSATELLIKLT